MKTLVFSNTEAYKSWRSMMQRCYNKGHEKRRYYAGRGITVCDAWFDFNNFYLDMGERPVGHSLDRIDSARGYEPGNCRWATRKEQMRNKSDNVNLTLDGRTQCVAAWSLETGLKRATISRRLKMGWSVKDTLTIRKNGRYLKKSAIKRQQAAEQNAA